MIIIFISILKEYKCDNFVNQYKYKLICIIKKKNTMEKHIYVSSYSTNDIIFDSESLKGCYFEQTNHDSNSNTINKAIIHSIDYCPDSTYCHTDGNEGTCWCSIIIDSSEHEYITLYHFRNFENLLEIFNEKGYKFIKKN